MIVIVDKEWEARRKDLHEKLQPISEELGAIWDDNEQLALKLKELKQLKPVYDNEPPLVRMSYEDIIADIERRMSTLQQQLDHWKSAKERYLEFLTSVRERRSAIIDGVSDVTNPNKRDPLVTILDDNSLDIANRDINSVDAKITNVSELYRTIESLISDIHHHMNDADNRPYTNEEDYLKFYDGQPDLRFYNYYIYGDDEFKAAVDEMIKYQTELVKLIQIRKEPDGQVILLLDKLKEQKAKIEKYLEDIKSYTNKVDEVVSATTYLIDDINAFKESIKTKDSPLEYDIAKIDEFKSKVDILKSKVESVANITYDKATYDVAGTFPTPEPFKVKEDELTKTVTKLNAAIDSSNDDISVLKKRRELHTLNNRFMSDRTNVNNFKGIKERVDFEVARELNAANYAEIDETLVGDETGLLNIINSIKEEYKHEATDLVTSLDVMSNPHKYTESLDYTNNLNTIAETVTSITDRTTKKPDVEYTTFDTWDNTAIWKEKYEDVDAKIKMITTAGTEAIRKLSVTITDQINNLGILDYPEANNLVTKVNAVKISEIENAYGPEKVNALIVEPWNKVPEFKSAYTSYVAEFDALNKVNTSLKDHADALAAKDEEMYAAFNDAVLRWLDKINLNEEYEYTSASTSATIETAHRKLVNAKEMYKFVYPEGVQDYLDAELDKKSTDSNYPTRYNRLKEEIDDKNVEIDKTIVKLKQYLNLLQDNDRWTENKPSATGAVKSNYIYDANNFLLDATKDVDKLKASLKNQGIFNKIEGKDLVQNIYYEAVGIKTGLASIKRSLIAGLSNPADSPKYTNDGGPYNSIYEVVEDKLSKFGEIPALDVAADDTTVIGKLHTLLAEVNAAYTVRYNDLVEYNKAINELVDRLTEKESIANYGFISIGNKYTIAQDFDISNTEELQALIDEAKADIAIMEATPYNLHKEKELAHVASYKEYENDSDFTKLHEKVLDIINIHKNIVAKLEEKKGEWDNKTPEEKAAYKAKASIRARINAIARSRDYIKERAKSIVDQYNSLEETMSDNDKEAIYNRSIEELKALIPNVDREKGLADQLVTDTINEPLSDLLEEQEKQDANELANSIQTLKDDLLRYIDDLYDMINNLSKHTKLKDDFIKDMRAKLNQLDTRIRVESEENIDTRVDKIKDKEDIVAIELANTKAVRFDYDMLVTAMNTSKYSASPEVALLKEEAEGRIRLLDVTIAKLEAAQNSQPNRDSANNIIKKIIATNDKVAISLSGLNIETRLMELGNKSDASTYTTLSNYLDAVETLDDQINLEFTTEEENIVNLLKAEDESLTTTLIDKYKTVMEHNADIKAKLAKIKEKLTEKLNAIEEANAGDFEIWVSKIKAKTNELNKVEVIDGE